ncbi:diguanylate cyclase (GGDEF)-like protein [Bacillus ectoiniformans]|uniref:putative bifunctional diguanylate cyclase/phosphodiesterase n=1 Tax=Bacillus ectoiniformans TaxID=1494429 RepID=UPI001956609F|nr:bifunctional diguanylate cyclase/phosphodiesterase [Bacillus ectoiniformans]MBM7649518.1 diguanylate cyclase (GGDEF)-like protein [Bacillus ectoiniformans]
MKSLTEFEQLDIILLSILLSFIGYFFTMQMNERIASFRLRQKQALILCSSLLLSGAIWIFYFLQIFFTSASLNNFSGLLSLSILSIVMSLYLVFYNMHNTRSKQSPTWSVCSIVTGGIIISYFSAASMWLRSLPKVYSVSYFLLFIAAVFVFAYTVIHFLRPLPFKRSWFYKVLNSLTLSLLYFCVFYTGLLAIDSHPLAMHSFESHPVLLYSMIALMFVSLLTAAALDRRMAEKLIYYDELTKLPNRRHLGEYTSQHLSSAQEEFMLIVFDIDNFKWINETFGYGNGNKIMLDLVTRLQSFIPAGSFLNRMEGNKFSAMLVGQVTADQALKKAKALLEHLDYPFYIEDQPVTLTASAGVSLSPDHGRSFEQLIVASEKALQHIKQNGKNQAVVYHPSVHDNDQERQIAMNFRKALKNNEFYLCYQPKYDVHKKQITSAEVLVRWESPIFGFVSPALFIPIAEKNGFITDLTHWILNEACRQMRIWSENGHAIQKIAVNISAQMFLSNTLHQTVMFMLNKHNLDGKHLELEITETSIMENLDLAVEVINRLKSKNISISLDDFGTGVSSLTYLKKLPIHTLKIDKAFIDDVNTSEEGKALVQMIINLAKLFNLQVVAEGVETEEQLKALIQLSCDEIQGYNISKPLKSDEIEIFVSHFLNKQKG